MARQSLCLFLALALALVLEAPVIKGLINPALLTRPPDELATLKVEIRDSDTTRAIPSRVYLTDGAGKSWAPPGLPSYDKGKEHHFVSPGSFKVQLPAGNYLLKAERGTEYLPSTARIRLLAGDSRPVTIILNRWVHMNRRGWFSGDLHNHRNAADMPALLLAEDLNLAPTITDWIWEDRQVARPLPATDAIKKVDPIHAYSLLDKEVERLESGPGAIALLGLRSPIPFDGYRLYPPNTIYCEAAHAQGGYVDAEKIVWRDVAALVALGHIDFAGIVNNHFNRHGVELETDRWGMIPKNRAEYNTVGGMPLWGMDVYYRFLNCGFRLPVSAGSASGVKASPLGYNRVYVKLDGPFEYGRWFRNLKVGRSFATNGPMLFLTANGKELGETCNSSGRTKLQVRAEAISSRPLHRLEIISNGRVIKTEYSSKGLKKLVVQFEVNANESGWIAARCFEQPGETIRFAHTSPIYIQTGKPRESRPEDARFFIDWIDREIRFYQNVDGFRSSTHRDEMLAFFRSARAVYAGLLKN